MLDPVYLNLIANSVEYATFIYGLSTGFILMLMMVVYTGWQEELFDEEGEANAEG